MSDSMKMDPYYDYLCQYYFSKPTFLDATIDQADFVAEHWRLIIKNAIWANLSPEQFKKKYKLRMKLVQPPENLL